MESEMVTQASITELQQQMTSGKLTSVALTTYYLEQIAACDKQGQIINAVAEVNPDALFIARSLDYERANGNVRGPLHGIPILLKDNINTGDDMQTTAGSLALEGHSAKSDAYLVHRLREAGAVILGKANLTEWANFMTEEGMPNGYSSRGGQVLNPYGPGRLDVGGSSSGSAAGVAAGFAAASVGTETSGSILSPASENSLVGIKPTVGLISRNGIIPISHSQDTAGPIAKTVEDAAMLLSVMSGYDKHDSVTWSTEERDYSDETLFDTEGLRGTRIGIPYDPYFQDLSDDEMQLMDNAVEILKEQGADLVELTGISPLDKDEDFDINVMLHEFKAGINTYLRDVDNGLAIHSLADVIAFNAQHADRALRFGQSILEKAHRTVGTLAEPAYLDSLIRDQRLSREEGIDRTIHENRLDALLFPGNYGAGIPAKAGYPSVTVPAGYSRSGRPLGLTFSGQAYSEYTLIRLAYAFEQASKLRVAPVLSQ